MSRSPSTRSPTSISRCPTGATARCGRRRAARRRSRACSSPPTGCRRSTASSPACPTRARCSTSWRRGGSRDTADIVANHVVSVPDPNALVARQRHTAARRGRRARLHHRRHRTSLWHCTPPATRTIYGHSFPDGMAKNTAARRRRSSRRPRRPSGRRTTSRCRAPTVVDARPASTPSFGTACSDAALACSHAARGRGAAGLILADTKYEFGLAADGDLLLIDEVHTPDSSRYWVADTLRGTARRRRGAREPRQGDRAPRPRRRRLPGDGDPPVCRRPCGRRRARATSSAFETITGAAFDRGSYPVEPRIRLPTSPTAEASYRRRAATKSAASSACRSPKARTWPRLAFFGLFALQHRGPGGRRHGGVRRAPRPHPQRRRSRHQRVHHRSHAAARRRARHRAHPLLHHRLVVRPQRPTVPRRDAHGPLAVGHNGNLVNAAELRDDCSRGASDSPPPPTPRCSRSCWPPRAARRGRTASNAPWRRGAAPTRS